MEQQENSIRIIREATVEDILIYKRGKKDVNPKKYYLCQCYCGNLWVPSKANYNKHLSTSCGQHSNEKRIINETGHIYGELVVLGPSEKRKTDNHKYWQCQCSCGTVFSVSGKDLREHKVNSCGCVKSKGAKLINRILTEEKIDYQTEYKFNNFLTSNDYPYRFDWAIFKNNKLYCLIEYDGEQHFDKTNRWYRPNVDEQKTQYCQQNNIPLYRIPYTEYSKINSQYLKKLINYEEE